MLAGIFRFAAWGGGILDVLVSRVPWCDARYILKYCLGFLSLQLVGSSIKGEKRVSCIRRETRVTQVVRGKERDNKYVLGRRARSIC